MLINRLIIQRPFEIHLGRFPSPGLPASRGLSRRRDYCRFTYLTLTPAGGFTGSVVLTAAITTNPNGVAKPPSFSFNSISPVTITGNAAGTGTFTVVTTASSSPSCTSSAQIPSGVPWNAGSGAALASLLLFVIPKRSRASRSIRSLVLLFIALVWRRSRVQHQGPSVHDLQGSALVPVPAEAVETQ